ncbi:uncharacterized protein B0I36DRAFT_317734 [Microdochium trichocladiopsis]|uniref:Uncharacterized protein n=1 Tax=Microdochium trichocladiopsis TaxID=1682393 RepID=A0A9P9BSS4_9PEZI|nr:uncharacterized protein B0I36DRAFT_317734 [Microdochium trichocladiopsis]KAH7035145.1 hypothetical protein B0I36DRAFT_317734 [Microdochium trichocladiopsis]
MREAGGRSWLAGWLSRCTCCHDSAVTQEAVVCLCVCGAGTVPGKTCCHVVAR